MHLKLQNVSLFNDRYKLRDVHGQTRLSIHNFRQCYGI